MVYPRAGSGPGYGIGGGAGGAGGAGAGPIGPVYGLTGRDCDRIRIRIRLGYQRRCQYENFVIPTDLAAPEPYMMRDARSHEICTIESNRTSRHYVT